MKPTDLLRAARHPFGLIAAAAVLAIAAPAVPASDESQSSGAQLEQKQDTVTVDSYKTRPDPTHEVSLKDGRVYFLKELEETDTGYVLHTLEDEIVEVEKDEVAELKKLK